MPRTISIILDARLFLLSAYVRQQCLIQKSRTARDASLRPQGAYAQALILGHNLEWIWRYQAPPRSCQPRCWRRVGWTDNVPQCQAACKQ